MSQIAGLVQLIVSFSPNDQQGVVRAYVDQLIVAVRGDTSVMPSTQLRSKLVMVPTATKAKAPSKSYVKKTGSHQCEATTKKGVRCSKMAYIGEHYCACHC